MSSYVTWSLNNELERLNTSHEELKESHQKLRMFILSDEFLRDYSKFEERIGEFQEKIVTLVEAISTPSPEVAQATQTTQPLQTQQQPPQEAQRSQEERYLWGKVIVAALSLLVVGVAVHQGYVPAETLQWAVAGTILLLFLPRILSMIHEIIQRKGVPEEEKAPGVKLEEWIHARLRWIRERHFKAWTAIRGENPVAETLDEYEILSVDPVVYDKKEYFKKRLAFEFLSTIGEIMAACNTNIWTRKSIVISAIVAAAQTPFAKG